MVAFPNSKINIGLNITGRRPDGYHDLETVFYPVGIRDALEVVEAPELTFTSTGLEIPGSPECNLCLKAYRLLAADFQVPHIHIHLHKHIPIGAGLGGGSADAAFFVRLMNEKFGLGLSDARMEDYCRQLGADCPFFIRNKPVFASGIGDVFSDISLDLGAHYLVLVKPPVHISTAEAYAGVKPVRPERPLTELVRLPVGDWKDAVVNDFEDSVFGRYPVVRAVRDALYEAGALYASMSGSGSSVYGIFRDPVTLPALEAGNQVFYGI